MQATGYLWHFQQFAAVEYHRCGQRRERFPSAPPTNGLALWLKADEGITTNADGTVANWADQSGYTNDAGPDQNGALAPSLITDTNIGKPVVAFNPNGSPMCLDVADAPSVELVSDLSLFYAVEFTNFANTTLPQAIVAKTFGNEPYPFDYQVIAAQAKLIRGNANGNASVASSGPCPPDNISSAGPLC